MKRHRTSILALAALVWALTGCAGPLSPSAPNPSTPTATKHGDGVARHDLAPLTSRIPALSTATAATWSAGTFDDDRVPGPTSYWIDAVVTIDHTQADRLRRELALTPASRPTLAASVDAAVPAGPLWGGEELNHRYTPDNWSGTVFLTAEGSTLVLLLVGGN